MISCRRECRKPKGKLKGKLKVSWRVSKTKRANYYKGKLKGANSGMMPGARKLSAEKSNGVGNSVLENRGIWRNSLFPANSYTK
jgi:hypothetical protein